ncbi:MAG: sulfatase [Prosthecobacter sp.]|nr:sulfatase [Prosthecobacter sp.]
MHSSTKTPHRIIVSLLILLVAGVSAESASGPGARPNILIAIADDMSWAHTSAARCKGVSTPNIDRVARNGVVFRNGICAAPGCSPSRAAFFTGRHVWMNEEASTHHGLFPAKFATFPDLLAKAGYTTGFTGKPWSPGESAPGRKDNPAGPGFSGRKLTPPYSGIKDNDYPANFANFLAKRKQNAPFCFWFGSGEPHRDYERGSGLKSGKKLADVQVPGFLPDTPEVRSDFLDYFTEIEWFDRNLGLMLDALEKAGELDNTLVIVTADNGMPMLRAKATCYEYGLHVPMFVAWPKRVPADRVVEDPIGFVDLNATILAAAQVEHPSKSDPALAPVGRDFLPLLTSDKQGLVNPDAAFVFAGHERHTLTRHNDIGYPIRALRTPQYLYLRNLRPDRWPVGDPRRINNATGQLLPLHAGTYRDIDDREPLDWIIERAATSEKYAAILELIVGKHPAEELYDIQTDPDCFHNLAGDPQHAEAKARLAAQMDAELKRTNDPRIHGQNPDIADTYPNVNPKNKMGESNYPAPGQP